MIRGLLSGHMFKARLKEPVDEFWDQRLGVKTFGYHVGAGEWGKRSWTAEYVPAAYGDVFQLFRKAGVGKDDVFVDIGAGLGRACFAAAYLGAGKVIGVELIPELAASATANAAGSKLANRDNVRFVAQNALDFDYSDITLLYLFHSLSEQNLTDLVKKIRATRAATGTTRRFRFAYLNPVYDHVFAEAGWLERTHSLPVRKSWFDAPSYAATIWEANG